MIDAFLWLIPSTIETNTLLECLTGWKEVACVGCGYILQRPRGGSVGLIQLLAALLCFFFILLLSTMLDPSVAGQCLVKGTECKADYLGLSSFLFLFVFL